jgi:hypothetical protein
MSPESIAASRVGDSQISHGKPLARAVALAPRDAQSTKTTHRRVRTIASAWRRLFCTAPRPMDRRQKGQHILPQ